MRGYQSLQLGQLCGVTAQEIEHVLTGADRTLDHAADALDQLRDPPVRDQLLVGGGGEALPSVVICAATLCERPAIGWSA